MKNRTYIRYSNLPDTSFTKIGWKAGRKPSCIDEFDIQFSDGEFSIVRDEFVDAVRINIWSDCFNHLRDSIFSEFSALKNPSMDDIEDTLKRCGFRCRNNEVE